MHYWPIIIIRNYEYYDFLFFDKISGIRVLPENLLTLLNISSILENFKAPCIHLLECQIRRVFSFSTKMCWPKILLTLRKRSKILEKLTAPRIATATKRNQSMSSCQHSNSAFRICLLQHLHAAPCALSGLSGMS